MKRTQIARGTSTIKRTRMRRRPRRARPDKDDRKYIDWIKRQRCACPCGQPGPCDPHHRPGAGVGARSHDHDAVPLRRQCHDDMGEFKGRFVTWLREDRQRWHSDQVAIHRARYERERAVDQENAATIERWRQLF